MRNNAAQEEKEEEAAAYCRGVTDQSESPRHNSRRSFVRSLARSLARESVSPRRGAFEGAISGHDSNGSEIVVSAFAPPGRPAILTQLRYESIPSFSVSFLPFLSRKCLRRSSRSGTRSFSLLFRFDERRVRVRVRALPTQLLANHSAPLMGFSRGERALTMFQWIYFYRRDAIPFRFRRF